MLPNIMGVIHCNLNQGGIGLNIDMLLIKTKSELETWLYLFNLRYPIPYGQFMDITSLRTNYVLL